MFTSTAAFAAGVLVIALGTPCQLIGQSHGGFVVTLGLDTVHVEEFVRETNRVTGTIAVRTPVFRLLKWSMTFDAAGKPAHYEVNATDAAGVPVLNSVSGTLTYFGDSVVRAGFKKGLPDTARMAAPSGAYPSPNIPYIGVSYLMYEQAFNDARRRTPRTTDSIPALTALLTMVTALPTPTLTALWFPAPDSVEMDYFGIDRSGFKFNTRGELIRADWTGTTYRYRIVRVPKVDVEGIAHVWADAERSGHAFGALSPRDSVKGSLGTAAFTFDYSRPAQRGRNLWGDVVPIGTVWRLGADKATHFTTSQDLLVGETVIPAGRYTLWMLLSADKAELIVSNAVNVWGTAYNPAKDLAHIPLQRVQAGDIAERLTLGINNGALQIHWGDTIWQVPVSVK